MRKTKAEQLQMFEQPNPEETVFAYAKVYALCDEAQDRMFNLSNVEDILRSMALQTFCVISDDSKVKMFDLPNAKNLVLWFVHLEPLCARSIMRVFELPNAEDIFCVYARMWIIPIEAQRKILTLPRAKEIFRIYTKKFSVSEEISKKLAELN